MASKRRNDGERPQRCHPRPPGDISDRRALEGVMRQVVAGLRGEADQDTPLARAHELLLHAYQVRDGQRRVRLAQAALAICPDCADAYALLTDHARSRKEALRLLPAGSRRRHNRKSGASPS